METTDTRVICPVCKKKRTIKFNPVYYKNLDTDGTPIVRCRQCASVFNKKAESPKYVKIGDCEIFPSGGRCDGVGFKEYAEPKCPQYQKCLELASSYNWPGWSCRSTR